MTLPPMARLGVAELGLAVAALDRDGVVVLERAVSEAACAAVRAQMAPYLEASYLVGAGPGGANARRPGAVLARSRASWAMAMHPAVLQLCEGVLGRQVLSGRSEQQLVSEMWEDRAFKQHPYNLDLTQMINIGPGGTAQVGRGHSTALTRVPLVVLPSPGCGGERAIVGEKRGGAGSGERRMMREWPCTHRPSQRLTVSALRPPAGSAPRCGEAHHGLPAARARDHHQRHVGPPGFHRRRR